MIRLVWAFGDRRTVDQDSNWQGPGRTPYSWTSLVRFGLRRSTGSRRRQPRVHRARARARRRAQCIPTLGGREPKVPSPVTEIPSAAIINTCRRTPTRVEFVLSRRQNLSTCSLQHLTSGARTRQPVPFPLVDAKNQHQGTGLLRPGETPGHARSLECERRGGTATSYNSSFEEISRCAFQAGLCVGLPTRG